MKSSSWWENKNAHMQNKVIIFFFLKFNINTSWLTLFNCPSLTITPDVALMSKLPVMDALQGHPLDGHLAGQKHITFSKLM